MFGKGVLPDANTMGAINPHTLTLELHCASRSWPRSVPSRRRGQHLCSGSRPRALPLDGLARHGVGQSYLDVVFSAFDRVQSAADIVDTFPHALEFI